MIVVLWVSRTKKKQLVLILEVAGGELFICLSGGAKESSWIYADPPTARAQRAPSIVLSSHKVRTLNCIIKPDALFGATCGRLGVRRIPNISCRYVGKKSSPCNTLMQCNWAVVLQKLVNVPTHLHVAMHSPYAYFDRCFSKYVYRQRNLDTVCCYIFGIRSRSWDPFTRRLNFEILKFMEYMI